MQNARYMLISSSYVVDRNDYLGYCREDLAAFLPKGTRVLFVPYAYAEYDKYTDLVSNALRPLGISVAGIHQVALRDADALVRDFDVVFCGGGNTFLLLMTLYKTGAFGAIQEAVSRGVRYMGSSAGANVAGPTIGTTNDMPIVQPPSFTSFGFVPFNINPHYYDRPTSFKHMGETRRDRIREFLTHNDVDVVALREGAILMIANGYVRLAGTNGAIVFRKPTGVGEITESKVVQGASVDQYLRTGSV